MIGISTHNGGTAVHVIGVVVGVGAEVEVDGDPGERVSAAQGPEATAWGLKPEIGNFRSPILTLGSQGYFFKFHCKWLYQLV